MSAARWFTLAFALVLIGTVVATRIELTRRPKATVPKVTIGARDGVYFEHGAKAHEALALGRALQATGFFSDRGTDVMLSRGEAGAIVTFVVNQGAWNNPATVASFEEIGRGIASSIGGFPIRVRLDDANWSEHKSLVVGKIEVGAKDAIYYFGTATEGDAVALGAALRQAGYLTDLGATVAVWKDGQTALGFVVADGVWNDPRNVAGFEQLVRHVAASVGGLPIELRLLSSEMEAKGKMEVR